MNFPLCLLQVVQKQQKEIRIIYSLCSGTLREKYDLKIPKYIQSFQGQAKLKQWGKKEIERRCSERSHWQKSSPGADLSIYRD